MPISNLQRPRYDKTPCPNHSTHSRLSKEHKSQQMKVTEFFCVSWSWFLTRSYIYISERGLTLLIFTWIRFEWHTVKGKKEDCGEHFNIRPRKSAFKILHFYLESDVGLRQSQGKWVRNKCRYLLAIVWQEISK